MPWKAKDATEKTHKADTPHKQRQWASTANRVLRDTGDEGKAVRIANAAVKGHGGKK
jgi:hypothetical protein